MKYTIITNVKYVEMDKQESAYKRLVKGCNRGEDIQLLNDSKVLAESNNNNLVILDYSVNTNTIKRLIDILGYDMDVYRATNEDSTIEDVDMYNKLMENDNG